MLNFCKLLPILILIVFLNGMLFAQTLPELEKVKEIKLLESTRDDVRRILGGYKLEAEEQYHYDWFSKDGVEIRVDYSEGNCEEFRSDGFKVSEWKAIYIIIEFNSPIKPKDLKINFSKYKKEKKFYDIDDLYVYYDKESGIVLTVRDSEIGTIEFIPPSQYYGLMCDEEKAKKLSATSSIFEDELKDRFGIPYCPVAGVGELNFSQVEVIASCNSSDSTGDKTCSRESKTVDIFTIANDPDGDSLTYEYKVSGGKIIGYGAKVW